MKALTVREPWASLIINGYKKYEFRSWKTNYRGKILIHSGQNIEKNNIKRFEKYNLEYISGAIIGEVELTDCVLVDENLEKKLIKDNPEVYKKTDNPRKYAWKFDKIVKYNNPIFVKGQLGLWNYDEKRQLIRKGDIIEFCNRTSGKTIITRVIEIHKFDSFDELYKRFDKISLGYNKNEIALPNDMEKFYSKELQQQYGVLGIELKYIRGK